jgi:acylphosphatase
VAGTVASGRHRRARPGPALPCIAVDGASDTDTDRVRLTAWVHGHVQGVGFRWWTRARALELGLVGTATNLPDGRVEVVAEGPEAACRRLLDAIRGPGSPGRVRTVVERWGASHGDIAGFVER